MQLTLKILRFSAAFCAVLWAAAGGLPAYAGEADVVGVNVTKSKPNVYTFRVTVRHGDTGWKHFANAWEILSADGKIIATRVLAHPHTNEQPFTRSLSGVTIPPGAISVTLRARDLVHGYGGKAMTIELPK